MLLVLSSNWGCGCGCGASTGRTCASTSASESSSIKMGEEAVPTPFEDILASRDGGRRQGTSTSAPFTTLTPRASIFRAHQFERFLDCFLRRRQLTFTCV